MKIKKPSKESFSDPRLHETFDKRIIQKIHHFGEVKEEFINSINSIREDDTIFNIILKRSSKKIINELHNTISFDNIKKNSRYFRSELWELSKKKNVCELCNMKRSHFDKAHILKRSAYRNNKLKPRKAFNLYIHSLANIALLCNNCHHDVDKKKLSNTKIRGLITTRHIINRRILSRIQKDINYMNNVIDEIDRIYNETEKKFKVLLRQFLTKRTKLSKTKIRKIID